MLKQHINNFHFTIIGDGPEKNNLQAYVQKNNLQAYVSFLPFIAPEKVRNYMDKADIYIFGSNFYEGWGAVVNEALNSGCAMLVSHAVGSAAYLIKNGESGFVYECGNVKDLSKKIRYLIENKRGRHNIAKNGYATLIELWNADVAVDRLFALYESIKNNGEVTWIDGPCAKAQIVKNNWIRGIKND